MSDLNDELRGEIARLKSRNSVLSKSYSELRRSSDLVASEFKLKLLKLEADNIKLQIQIFNANRSAKLLSEYIQIQAI